MARRHVLTLAASAPPPNAPVPREPARFASAFAGTSRALDAAIDAWRAREPQTARPPRDVELLALYQQRLYLRLTADAPLAAAVLRRLPPRLRSPVAEIVSARRLLVRLTRPTTRPPSSFETGRPAPAAALLRHYRSAQRRFGVPWSVLAAVNFVETAFGKVRSESSDGAQGPIQFLPATWRAYGLGGNVHRPRDAILGAANYLRASGAPRDLRRPLYAYNHSSLYVEAVLRLARRMGADRRAFFAFYSWQVYIRTPRGPRRITGPGLP